MDEPARQSNPLTPIAIAIVLAGAFIAIAIYMVSGGGVSAVQVARTITIPPVTADDHVLGNPNAPIKIVEYSDLDCPFCRTFNATMKQVMAVYGQSGKVAWVYRHFPIVELHPNAPTLAEAAECVAELGGNDAFWKFVDGVFTSPILNDHFDMSKLESIVAVSGVPVGTFSICLSSGKYKDKVAGEFKDATAAGGQGTPHNIIISGSETIPVPGSQPYATVKSIIDTLLADTGTK